MKIQEILSLCRKPGRYIGREKNAFNKPWQEVDIRSACVFPDLYEIGMSHMGLQILYEIINKSSWALADRAYCPDTDLEYHLRAQGVDLFGLETRRPLHAFDCLFITLPYELCFSNIFTILDLSRIPVWQQDRESGAFPLVVGGGSCCLNPEPVAQLFDVIVIGDGEEAVIEVLEALRRNKEAKGHKKALLKTLSNVPGIYVPSFYKPRYGVNGRFLGIEAKKGAPERVKRRVIPELSASFQPQSPLVPNIQVVHDRLGLEIARGCTRGCRYCQASTTYRPVRERQLTEILSLVDKGLHATGWEEISLLSLSTGDYSAIESLITELMDRYVAKNISVSLPSLRVGTLTPAIMEQIGRVRKTGFTLAPEAGSERLRKIINKGITEEALLETAAEIGARGWSRVKLYFMIGLPFEAEDDVLAIPDLARKVLKAISNTKVKRHGAKVTVSVGTFVPKAHTPFQWEGQLSIEESRRRLNLIKDRLKGKKFQVKWHDPVQSFLEGVFSRGDRRLSAVIFEAWQMGARLDAWTDNLRANYYFEAASRLGIDLESYLRLLDLEDPLPWDHIDSGVKKAFLLLERKKALGLEYTPDCRINDCQGCGVCDFKKIKPVLARPPGKEKMTIKAPKGNGSALSPFFGHIGFSKLFDARFLGHLDMVRMFLRAIRRAGLPVAYSQGFHPMPKVSFSQPVPLGTESLGEEAVLVLEKRLSAQVVMDRLNREFPLDITVSFCEISRKKYRLLPKEKVSYLVFLRGIGFSEAEMAVSSLAECSKWLLNLEKKGKTVTVDLKQRLSAISCIHLEELEDNMQKIWAGRVLSEVSSSENSFLKLEISQDITPYLQPTSVISHIFNMDSDKVALLRILKLA